MEIIKNFFLRIEGSLQQLCRFQSWWVGLTQSHLPICYTNQSSWDTGPGKFAFGRNWAKLPSVGEICDFGRKMGEIMYTWTFLYWVLQALKRCFTLSRVSNVQIMQKHLITYICDVFFDDTLCYPCSGLVSSGISSLFSFCLAYLIMVLLNGHTLSV